MAKKNWKKVLSFAIALSMVLGMMTIGVAAAGGGGGHSSDNYESITVNVNGEQAYYNSGAGDTWLKRGDDWSVEVEFGDNCIYVSAGNQQNIKIAIQWDATQSINSSSVEQYGMYDHAVINITVTHVKGDDGEEHKLSDIIYKVVGEEPATCSADPASLGETDVVGGTTKSVASDLTTTETTNAAGETGTWSFSGWSTDDAEVSGNSFTMPEHDVTFVGTWTFTADPVEPVYYTVTYEYTGTVPANAPAVPASADYEEGASVIVAAAPTLDGYTFSGWDTSDFTMPAEDVVIQGCWTENVPDPVYYTLTVLYVNEDGEEIAESEITEGILEGTEYTTEQKVIDGYIFRDTDGDTSGIILEDTLVVYIYTKKIAYYGLVVNYIDIDGNVIADQIVKEGIPENTAYSTEQKSIPGYTFEMLDATSDAVSGIMDGDKEVTYIYTRNPVYYTLTVNYVTDTGEELTAQIIESNKLEGNTYITEQKEFSGYSFQSTSGDAASGIMDGDKEVTYIYTKNPVYYTLTVNYVTDTGVELTAQIVEPGKLENTAYSAQQLAFEGYSWLRTEGDATSGIMDSDKEVTFVYSEDPEFFTLIVNYVDETGATLAPQIIKNGLEEGTSYTTELKSFSGYTFTATSGDATSGIMDSHKTVTYIYTKNLVYYTLTVNYVTDTGEELTAQIVESNKLEGSTYTTELKEFSGYSFKKTSGDATFGIMNGNKEVTYIYTKDIVYYTLTVNYEDTDGNAIAPQIVNTKMEEGTAYSTRRLVIEDYAYQYTTGDAVRGIMDNDKEVTYVYDVASDPEPEPDPEPDPEPEPEPEPIPEPIDIPDEEVPLTDIPDEEVPKTGDMSVLVATLFAASGLGLTGLGLTKKRKEDEE